jgi:hypothetical protein
MLKGIGVAILVVIALLGIGWLATGNDFFLYKVFAPKYEAVRRETFEQSHAYRQGMIQDLHRIQYEYVQADPEHRGGLASIALQRVGDVADPESLPADVRSFVSCLRHARSERDYSDTCAPN